MKKDNKTNLQIQFDTVSTGHLRAEVTNRLITAQRKSSLQDNFQQVCTKQGTNEVAGMLMSMFIFGALFHGAEQALGLDGIIPDGAFAAAAEVAIELRDDKCKGNAFRNKVEGYPEGRRNDPMAASRTRKEFNLVSNNDNQNFEMDADLEVAALSEMLNLITQAEKGGQVEMKVAQGQTIQSALRMNRKGFMNAMAA